MCTLLWPYTLLQLLLLISAPHHSHILQEECLYTLSLLPHLPYSPKLSPELCTHHSKEMAFVGVANNQSPWLALSSSFLTLQQGLPWLTSPLAHNPFIQLLYCILLWLFHWLLLLSLLCWHFFYTKFLNVEDLRALSGTHLSSPPSL